MVSGQLIREVVIDWSKIDEGSYLRGIPAISGVGKIGFGHNVTFSSAKTEAGNPLFWRQLLLRVALILRAGQGITVFRRMTLIRNFVMRFG